MRRCGLKDSQDLGVRQGFSEGSSAELYRGSHDIKRRRRTSSSRIYKTKAFKGITGIILVALMLAGALFLIYTWDQHLIVDGVSVSGINVGDLTQDQAKTTIDKEVQRLLSQTLKLNIGKQSHEVTLEDLGLSVSSDLALQQAYDISRKGSISNRVISKMNASKGVNFDFSFVWDEQKLTNTLNKTLEGFSTPATDATFEITNQNTMNIHKEHVGETFDINALMTKIKALDIKKPLSEINVDLKEELPKITASQLEDQKITGLLASYTTRFDPAQVARTDNVRIAAKALDMAVVKPGSFLSFNQIVGERTVAAGYKDAYIIVNGQFVPGLAGGICQVSSTLYNAGLLANLPVTQRSNHDLAISYVPLGQDATVAYPNLDLKFHNNTGGYLLVRTRTTSDSVTIDLYGKVNRGQEVTISNTTESTIPPEVQHLVDETLGHGVSILKQQGQPGYIVSSVRIVKMNGKVVNTESLPKSVYKALPKVYAVGS